jgi:choline dehydrogenase
MTHPGSVDVLVLGGGTSGAVLAGRLAELTDASVLLLEAGPDYGPLSSGRWPAELLDASQLPLTHDWGYTSENQIAGRVIHFDRARVIGGCSSHNGCQIAIGHRLDYDGWAARGNQGWAADDLRPYIAAAKQRLRVRTVAEEELTPFGCASLHAMLAAGLPRARDLTDLDDDTGVAPNPANVLGRVRWNAAFAYLDPVRGNRLKVIGNALADRLLIRRDRVIGAVAVIGGRQVTIHAGLVAVCAGVYGSPAILLRSGIGDPVGLARAGIRLVHALPGVGQNLHDHPAIELSFAGTAELERRSQAFTAGAFHPEEQLIAKIRSSRCRAGFDLHIYTQGGTRRQEPGRWIWEFMAAVLTPKSRGTLRLRSSDPGAAPIIDHGFLTDLDGADVALLAEAYMCAREITRQPELAALLGPQTAPGDAFCSAGILEAGLRHSVVHAYHPVGTCMMGPHTDPLAVVDPSGRIHGLTGGYVVDAAIMPVVPRANTNLPAAVVAERVASLLAHDRTSNRTIIRGKESAWPGLL